LKNLQKEFKIERFDNFNSDYFKRAYQVSAKLDQKELLKQLAKTTEVVGIESIERIDAFSVNPAKEQNRFQIEDQLFAYQWGLVRQGQSVRKDKDDINYVLIHDQASQSSTPDWLTLLGDQAANLPADVLANLLAAQKPTKAF